MRMPETLSALVDEGIIEEVLRPLMSGKEAQIYLVVAGGRECVAKIYKEAQQRTFKHRADYTEGRKVRNSRDQRAIDKRSKHGRGQDEAAWRSTEVDMIYRLQAAGVRVPAPYHFIDGVLVMELVTDASGNPAPRLGEVRFSPEQARAIYDKLIREVVRMLCAGVVHGDLSDFNVLMGQDGPVIIDLPQAIDPSKNQNARKLLLRDVENLHRFLARHVPAGPRVPYAEEMWSLYESNRLTPETLLRGQYRASQKKADTDALLEFIGEVNEDERRRRGGSATGGVGAAPRARRVEVIVDKSHHRPKTAPARGGPQPPQQGGAQRPARQNAPTRPAQQRPPLHAAPQAAARAAQSGRGNPVAAHPRPARPEGASARVAASGPAGPNGAAASGEGGSAPRPGRRRRRRKPNSSGATPQVGPARNAGLNGERQGQARPPPQKPERAHPRADASPHERPRHDRPPAAHAEPARASVPEQPGPRRPRARHP